MSLVEGSCAVVRCRNDGDLDVVVGMQVVCAVCEPHAEQLGAVEHVPARPASIGPLRVYVDDEMAEGWTLIATLVNSKDRVVLYPPGEPLPPDPPWRPHHG